MKKVSIMTLAIVVSLIFVFANAYAGEPSAKATANCTKIILVQATSSANWSTFFSQTIHTSNQKDLFIDVSFETGLTTNTKVVSKKLQQSMAEAEAMVQIRVLVDGKMAQPGEITFNRRKQTMIAEFAGDISQCISIDATTGALVIDEDCIAPESLQLILDTMSANSFNFLAPDVAVGVHTVEVQALIDSSGTTNSTSPGALALANAYIGKGSVTVESVRMVKGEDVVLE